MAPFPRRDYTGPPRRKRVSASEQTLPRQASVPTAPAAETAWENQAQWYDNLHSQGGADLYQAVLLPMILKRLGARKGQRVLDVGCGQGVLGRALAHLGVASIGIDASPALIAAAQARAGANERHLVGDARKIADVIGEERFDHAAAVMVLQDMSPIDAVLAGAAAAIQPGGRLVIALTHPCFRQPKRTSWGWDEDQRQQFRRIDGYLSPYQTRIATHPGAVHGTPEAAMQTLSSHRPLSAYINACGAAGLGIIGCDELTNPRRGTQGKRYAAEDLAAREIPLFLVLTATKLR